MTGKIKIAIAAAVLIAVGTIAGRWLSVEKAENATYPIKLYGNIDIRTADLGFIEQERIVQIWVEEGQRVRSGQPLALQDTRRVEAQIEQVRAQISAQQQVVKRLETGNRPEEIAQARAEVVAARAVLKNAQLSFERLKTTSQAGVTSVQTRDDARAHLDVAQAQLQVKEKTLALALEGPRKEDIEAARHTLASLEASRSLLEVRLADMTLCAPADGVVQNRILEPGEMTYPNRPVIALALTDPKWVRVYVPEPKLGQIKLGLNARIHTDSYPDRPFHGWVGFVSPVAEFTPKSVETEELRPHLVYETRIFVKDPDDQLRLGMPVSVSIDSTMSPDAPPPAATPASAAQG